MASKSSILDLAAYGRPLIQIAALKHLKNECIGHVEKRETLVGAGIVSALDELLTACIDQLLGQSTPDGADLAETSQTQAEEMSRLCLNIFTSLAHGGAAFYDPLNASGLPILLCRCLNPRVLPPRTVAAALKAYIAIFDAKNCKSLDERYDSTLQDLVLGRSPIEAFAEIFSDTTISSMARLNTTLACQLLERLLNDDQHREAVEPYGLVPLLATHVVSFYVHNHPRSSHLFNVVVGPLPAPPSVQALAHVLGALCALVANSRYRVATLLFSSGIFSVLPFVESQARWEPKIHQPSQQSAYDVSPRDLLLPWVHSRIEKADNTAFSSAFPALGSSRSGLTSRASGFLDFADVAPTPDNRGTSPLRGSDSAFLAWLVQIMRTTDNLCRVKASSLFAAILKTKYISGGKDRFVALLVVPLLVDVMRNATYSQGALQGASNPNPAGVPELQALCEVPLVLAGLLTEMPTLQKFSAEAQVIKELVQYLKGTFGPFEMQAPHWSAQSEEPFRPTSYSFDEEVKYSKRMGKPGIPANILWLFQCRENALHLLAALTTKDDAYRKKFCDNGMVQCIIDSLNPIQDEFFAVVSKKEAGARREKLDAKLGNPESVLLAACSAARTMSRSVTLMRTSLVDAALAKPVYSLVEHENLDVVIAATEVICNLIMEFSPMRHDIVEAGAIKTLCAHAHDDDPKLRATSLWALKHLVNQAPNEVKMACIEELGPGWLDHIISSSPSASTSPKIRPFSSISGANSKGERVDILQPLEDETMEDASSIAGPRTSLSHPGADKSAKFTLEALTPGHQAGHAAYLSEVRRAEDMEAASQAEKEQVRIRVHALDFIRNITTGPGNNDMIDHLYERLGTQRIFDIIASKLRPLPNAGPAPPSSAAAGELAGQDMVARFQPAPLLTSAIFVLSHIAASAPRNRQHLVSQTPLLALVRALYRYPEQEVRAGCLWVAINLMWVDDASDQAGARARQQAMAQMGFREEIRARMDDASYDVMERARTANDLIEGRSGQHTGRGPAR